MVAIQLVCNLLAYKNSEIVQSQLKEQVKIIFPYTVIVIGYLALLGIIGYIFDTVLFCIASLVYLKFKNKIVMIILSIVLTLLLYFVFTRFLSVILPRGSWISLNL